MTRRKRPSAAVPHDGGRLRTLPATPAASSSAATRTRTGWRSSPPAWAGASRRPTATAAGRDSARPYCRGLRPLRVRGAARPRLLRRVRGVSVRRAGRVHARADPTGSRSTRASARIGEIGRGGLADEVKERYTCPSCGTLNSAYDLKCRSCGHEPGNDVRGRAPRGHRSSASWLRQTVGSMRGSAAPRRAASTAAGRSAAHRSRR